MATLTPDMADKIRSLLLENWRTPTETVAAMAGCTARDVAEVRSQLIADHQLKHKYIEAHRKRIIEDLLEMGRAATARKWDVSQGGFSNIVTRWIRKGFVEDDQIPRIVSPGRHSGRPSKHLRKDQELSYDFLLGYHTAVVDVLGASQEQIARIRAIKEEGNG